MEDVMSDANDPILPGATPVPLKDVDFELSRQLHNLQGHLQDVVGHMKDVVQKVRMSNLVIYCNTVEAARQVAVQVPDVVAVHPARVLLLVGDNGSTDANVSAAVRVEVRGLAVHQLACSEQVVLSAPAGLADRLPFAVRSLSIGDLPTNLWWASPQPPPLAGNLLYDLAEYAQQIMYDSLGWPDPARGVAATATWLESVERFNDAQRWRVASDLNWRRLKYWRRLVTQALEPVEVDSITEVAVSHGPHAVVQAWELLSWLAARVGWRVQHGKVRQGVEMAWQFQAPQGDVRFCIKRLEQGPPEIKGMRIRCCLENKPVTLHLACETAGKLVIRLEGVEAEPRTLMLPEVKAAEVIGKQLSDRERDPVFRESMQVAQVMAKSLLS
jgi:glucose-6-phosphate dehydrogenase assembly protein OpcA